MARSKNTHHPLATTQISAMSCRFSFLEKPQTTVRLKLSPSRSYHFRQIRTEKQTTRSIKKFTEDDLITTHYPFSGNLEVAGKTDSKHPANRFHKHKKEPWHGPGTWTLSSHTVCLLSQFLLNQMIRSNGNSQNFTELETPNHSQILHRSAPCVCIIRLWFNLSRQMYLYRAFHNTHHFMQLYRKSWCYHL